MLLTWLSIVTAMGRIRVVHRSLDVGDRSLGTIAVLPMGAQQSVRQGFIGALARLWNDGAV